MWDERHETSSVRTHCCHSVAHVILALTADARLNLGCRAPVIQGKEPVPYGNGGWGEQMVHSNCLHVQQNIYCDTRKVSRSPHIGTCLLPTPLCGIKVNLKVVAQSRAIVFLELSNNPD